MIHLVEKYKLWRMKRIIKSEIILPFTLKCEDDIYYLKIAGDSKTYDVWDCESNHPGVLVGILLQRRTSSELEDMFVMPRHSYTETRESRMSGHEISQMDQNIAHDLWWFNKLKPIRNFFLRRKYPHLKDSFK